MMQYASLLSISMALISSVRSQDSSDLNTQIASTILQFQGAQIVPNVIPTANLTGALTVAFGDTQATIGQLFDGVDALQTSPTYNVQFRDSPEDDARYTVAFVDPSFVGSDQSELQASETFLGQQGFVGVRSEFKMHWVGVRMRMDSFKARLRSPRCS